MTSLYELTASTIAHIDSLMQESHIDELPEEIRKALFDSIAQDATAKQLNVAAYILNLESDVKQMKDYIEAMNDRKKSAESKIERLKGLLSWSMQALAINETKGPEFTIKLKDGSGRVEVDNEALVPSRYKISQPDKISKEAIRDDLKKGVKVDGARLVIDKKLTIK